MNYRKFFSDYYNIEIPKEYDIHHIDFNRENNKIQNLIVIPYKLHRKYHFLRNIVSKFDYGEGFGSIFMSEYYLNSLEKYANVCRECNLWMNLKYLMDGENIDHKKIPDDPYFKLKLNL